MRCPVALLLALFVLAKTSFAAPGPSSPFGLRLALNSAPGGLSITWSTITALTTLPCVEFVPLDIAPSSFFSLSTSPSSLGRHSGHSLSPQLICGGGTSRPFVEPSTGLINHFIHTIALRRDGLSPELRYAYRCGNDADGWSSRRTFTAPLPPGMKSRGFSPTGLLIFGDMGVAHSLTLPSLAADVASGAFSVAIHAGDLAYDLASLQGRRGRQFLAMMEPVSSFIPYMVAAGNHEALFNFSHYRRLYAMPHSDVSENLYYSFDVGPVHVAVYNTEAFFWPQSFNPDNMRQMVTWLAEDLAAAHSNRQAVPWVVVVGHRPMYCGAAAHTAAASPAPPHCSWECEASRRGVPTVCPHNNPRACHPAAPSLLSLAESSVEQLFQKFKVDVAVYGHVHAYQRFLPVFNYSYDAQVETSHQVPGAAKVFPEPPIFYKNPNATVHVTSGAGGNSEMRVGRPLPPPLGPCAADAPWCAFQSGFAPSANENYDFSHSRVFAWNETHLQWQQYSSTRDAVVDEWWVVREKKQ